jgi:hypothetical protein
VIEATETVGEEGLAALAWTPATAPAQLLRRLRAMLPSSSWMDWR